MSQCGQFLSECVLCQQCWQCPRSGGQFARRLARGLARQGLARQGLRFATARRHWARLAARPGPVLSPAEGPALSPVEGPAPVQLSLFT